jgi:hypothetical protein
MIKVQGKKSNIFGNCNFIVTPKFIKLLLLLVFRMKESIYFTLFLSILLLYIKITLLLPFKYLRRTYTFA